MLLFVGSSSSSRSSSSSPPTGPQDLQHPGPLAGQGTVLREQRDLQSNTAALYSEDQGGTARSWRYTSTLKKQLLLVLRVQEICWGPLAVTGGRTSGH